MKKILKIGALVLLMGSIVLILSTEKVFANFPMISVPLFKETVVVDETTLPPLIELKVDPKANEL